MHCRDILFTPCCSPRAREFPISGQLSLRRTAAELRGVKVAQFSNFCLFSQYKTLKTYLPVISLQPRGYIAEWFRFIPASNRRSKGVPSGTGDFLRLLIWELGTPKLAQIFAYGKWLYPYIMLLHGHQIWTKDVCKRAILRMNVLSHQIFLPLPPKSPQTPILGDLSMRNLLYRELSVIHTLMEHDAETLRLYML